LSELSDWVDGDAASDGKQKKERFREGQGHYHVWCSHIRVLASLTVVMDLLTSLLACFVLVSSLNTQ
jgi:hypothetical protein